MGQAGGDEGMRGGGIKSGERGICTKNKGPYAVMC